MDTEKKRKLRLAFVLPGRELWLKKLVRDLHQTARELDMEVFLLSEGSAPDLPCTGMVDLDSLKYSPEVRQLIHSERGVKLEPEKRKREYLYDRARFNRGFSQKKTARRYCRWIQEGTALFRLIRPDMVWIWNGLVYRSAAYAQGAENLGLPVMYAEKGVLPDSWALDPAGVNAASSLKSLCSPKVSDKQVQNAGQLLDTISRAGKSAWKQPHRLSRHSADEIKRRARHRKVIFFPGQVDSDSNIICFSPHFSNSLQVIEKLCSEMGESFFVLVKPHPMGQVSAAQYQAVLGDRGMAVADIHVLDAIDMSDLVVTINSTVAFEASVRRKPVLVTGRGIMNHCDFICTYRPEAPFARQIEECLRLHAAHAETWHILALARTAFMKDSYYFFLGHREKLLQSLSGIRAHTDWNHSPNPDFSILRTGEIVFSRVPDPGGGVLFSVFCRKIREIWSRIF